MSFETFSRDEKIKGGSDRSFGLVFGGACAVIGLWPLWYHQSIRVWLIALGALFVLIALLNAGLLGPLNRIWMLFGLALGKIITPLVMGVLLYGLFAPIGLAQRMFGRDALKLKRDPNAASYWEKRQPPGPPPQDMKNQF